MLPSLGPNQPNVAGATPDPFALPAQTPLTMSQPSFPMQPPPLAPQPYLQGPPKRKSVHPAIIVLGIFGALILVAAVAGVVSVAARSSRERWQNHKSISGRYSVDFPGRPSHRTKQTPPPVNITVYFTQVDQGSRGAFFAVYADYPPGVTTQGAHVIMNRVSTGQLSTMAPYKVTKRQKISLQGKPGLEVHATGVYRHKGKKLQAGIRLRIYIVGNRAYQVFWVGPRNRIPEEKIQRMFDSFKFTSV